MKNDSRSQGIVAIVTGGTGFGENIGRSFTRAGRRCI
jgi:hypothetical protein